MTLVVNLYGGPGTGKSTTAAHLFALLKHMGINAELVTEFAKGVAWEDRTSILGNQIYMFSKQHHQVWRVLGKADVVITDSPILLSCVYGKNMSPTFLKLVMEEHDKMNTIDIFLERIKPYQKAGRFQDETEARKLDDEILELLTKTGMGYFRVKADSKAADEITKIVLERK